MKTLDNITVLDLTRLLPGGVATMMLADLGADVIKVEDPIAGDYARWMPPQVDGLGAFFRASNRNKRSIIVNLKHEDGLKAFLRLVEKADVLIEGFRPQVTTRLGIDYDSLKAINPRLVYCSLSGWGQGGAYSDISAHDMNYLALGGVLGGMRDPQPLGGQVADVGGAYVAVMGILAALLKRERTGAGDYIDASLFEGGMLFGMYQFVESMTIGTTGGTGTLTGGMSFYDVYTSSDGKPMTFGAIEPKFFANFCNVVGHPEWIPLQNDMTKQAHLKNEISALFATKTAQEWHDLLADADCCFTLVTDPADLLDDPHIQERNLAFRMPDGVPSMRSPIRLQGDGEISVGAVPEYGEHTDEVFRSIGLRDEDIAALRAVGAIGRVEA